MNLNSSPVAKFNTPSLSKLSSKLPTSLGTGLSVGESISTTTTKSVPSIFQSIYFKIFLLILILSYLGINLFQILATATDDTTNAIREPLNKILGIFGYTISNTSKQIVKIGADSALFGIDVTSGAAKDAINISKEVVGLDDAVNIPNQSSQQTPKPDEVSSEIQSIKKNKSGYCYVGEDRGIRSCVKIDNTQTCMSGDIYPTHDICVNPSLRM